MERKVLALDLETTGINRFRCQILEIGAVIVNLERNRLGKSFNMFIKHEYFTGEAIGLQMAADNGILMKCKDSKNTLDIVLNEFEDWIVRNDMIGAHPIGFNVGAFDIPFLEDKGFNRKLLAIRSIELGTLFSRDDGIPTSSSECVEDILGKSVAHRAIDDARDAANLFLKYRKGVRLPTINDKINFSFTPIVADRLPINV